MGSRLAYYVKNEEGKVIMGAFYNRSIADDIVEFQKTRGYNYFVSTTSIKSIQSHMFNER